MNAKSARRLETSQNFLKRGPIERRDGVSNGVQPHRGHASLHFLASIGDLKISFVIETASFLEPNMKTNSVSQEPSLKATKAAFEQAKARLEEKERERDELQKKSIDTEKQVFRTLSHVVKDESYGFERKFECRLKQYRLRTRKHGNNWCRRKKK